MRLERITGSAVSHTIAALAVLLAASIAASDPAPSPRGRCSIEFFASSTLHDFSGRVGPRDFSLEPHVDPRSGEPWWSGSVAVPVAEMDTGIARRDENLRAMFDAEHFPRIVASIERIDRERVAALGTDSAPVLPVELTIRNVTRPVEALVSHWREDGALASFDVEFEVSLESFGLEAPAVLGLIRVDDVVRVHGRVTVDLPPSIAESGAGPV